VRLIGRLRWEDQTAEGAALPVTIFAPRQKPAVSRNGRTQVISNYGVCFVAGDKLKPGVELDLTIPVEITAGGELLLHIAGKATCAEDRSEDSIGKFGIAAAIGDYEMARNATTDP
jgi:hypothetical protein